jgi:hypothetical protein
MNTTKLCQPDFTQPPLASCQSKKSQNYAKLLLRNSGTNNILVFHCPTIIYKDIKSFKLSQPKLNGQKFGFNQKKCIPL